MLPTLSGKREVGVESGIHYQHGTKDEIAGMEAEKIGLEPLVREIKRRERKRQAELQRLSCPSISPDTVSLICGNCRTVLGDYPDNYFDACICDPPYGINIAGWDRQVPPLEDWQEIFRVLKPGGFCTAFASPRLYHRLGSLIELAGFEIKDMVQWIVSYKMARGNNLRPAHEPICIAQKPYERSLEFNTDKWGVGFANIEDARIRGTGVHGGTQFLIMVVKLVVSRCLPRSFTPMVVIPQTLSAIWMRGSRSISIPRA